MTPVWVFPAYPLLLAAPFAANLIAQAQANGYDIHSLAIAFCAITVQGTGFLISFMVVASFLYRLMSQKLPKDMQRPGVVSPCSLYFFHMSLEPELNFHLRNIVHINRPQRIHCCWNW